MSREVSFEFENDKKIPIPFPKDDCVELELTRERNDIISEIRILCGSTPKDICGNENPFDFIKRKSSELKARYINNQQKLHSYYLQERCEHNGEYFNPTEIWFGCIDAPKSKSELYSDIEEDDRYIDIEWGNIELLMASTPKDLVCDEKDCEGSRFSNIEFINMEISRTFGVNSDIDDYIYNNFVRTKWMLPYWDNIYRYEMKLNG